MTDAPNPGARRMSRRDMLKIAGFGSLALVLAACGQSAGSPAAPEGATPEAGGDTSAAAPTEVPTPTPLVLGSGNTKLNFWHGLGGADGATMITMLQEYSAQHPDVMINAQTFSDWAVFYQKLPTATAAGTPPDMAIQHEFSILQFADQGIIQDADPLFYADGLIPKNDFNPAIINTVTVGGKTMGVPFDNHGWGLFINKKLIQDAGLDPENLPANGTEFIEWAQKITVDDQGKHPNESGFNPDRIQKYAIHHSWVRFTMPSTLWQFGGGVLTDDGMKAILDSEQSIAAAQFWHDLMYKYYVCPPATPGTAGSYDMFKSDSLALMWDGSWSLNFFRDNPDIEQVTKNAMLNSLAPDGKQAAKVGSHMLVVPTGVQDPGLSAAKDLIKWLSDSDMWAQSGQLPARLSVQNQPSVQEIWTAPAFVEEFQKIGKTEVPHKSITEIVTIYEAAWSAVMGNTTPVEQSLKEANTAIQAILDRG